MTIMIFSVQVLFDLNIIYTFETLFGLNLTYTLSIAEHSNDTTRITLCNQHITVVFYINIPL